MGHEIFAKWIAESGMRKGAIASSLHVSPGQFSRWLTGSCTPQLTHRIAIEKLTGGAVKVDGWAKP